ncbi:MAG TPA: hypothetical protein VLV50_08520 [Stellaceae bacterium]|nr:hypothetical protein [Stellaceae bacterium]
MSDALKLRIEAARARRLASGTHDTRAYENLIKLAEELEGTADALEAQEEPAAGSIGRLSAAARSSR